MRFATFWALERLVLPKLAELPRASKTSGKKYFFRMSFRKPFSKRSKTSRKRTHPITAISRSHRSRSQLRSRDRAQLSFWNLALPREELKQLATQILLSRLPVGSLTQIGLLGIQSIALFHQLSQSYGDASPREVGFTSKFWPFLPKIH